MECKTKIVKYKEVEQLKCMKKEGVDIKDDHKTTYLGAFYDNKLVGVVGWRMLGNVLRYKTDFVLKEYRGKGIYSKLWKEREDLCDGKNRTVTAFCTEKSISMYLSCGFKVFKEGRVKFVKRIV